MNEITLAPAIIGAVSSIVTEALKFIPFLNKNSTTRSITSIVVIVIAVFISYGGTITDWKAAGVVFVQAVVYALATYKVVIQPIATDADLKTQQ